MQNAPLKFGGILKTNPIISEFRFSYLTLYIVLIVSPFIHFLLMCLLSDTIYGNMHYLVQQNGYTWILNIPCN